MSFREKVSDITGTNYQAASMEDLFQANEEAANRVNMFTHLVMLFLVLILSVSYLLFLSEESLDTMGPGWIYLYFVAPFNVIGLLISEVIGLRSKYLKYILLGLFTIVSTVTTGLCGNPETFLLFLPIVLAIRYFNPKTTVIISAIMIPMSVVAVWLNVKWGYPEINMLHLPEGTMFEWTDNCEPLFIAAGPDQYETFMNHLIWRVPITVTVLILVGCVATVTSAVGRRMIRQQIERIGAEAAEKTRSHFFATVSHDIRTPLNAIIGFSELLQAGQGTEEERKEALDSIIVSGKTLLQLINDVLDLSKLDAGKMEFHSEPTDVKTLISQVLNSFKMTSGKSNVALQMFAEEIPPLEIDPQRIRQILFNLIGNAMKFTEKGYIRVTAAYSDGNFSLSVEDTGIGISYEDQRRLMQPYVQLNNKGKHGGTGLGLSICKQLARRMGGELTLKSKLGKGTSFYLVIPNVKRSTTTALKKIMPTEHNLEQVKSVIKKIMIVDDSPINIAMLKAMLTKAGISDIKTAENGKLALEKLRENSDYDLILTDMWMPEMDGEELVKAIREDTKLAHLRVFAVTADVEAQKSYKNQGFNGLLLKPLTLSKLQDLLSGIANGDIN